MNKHTPGPWSVPHFAEPEVNCECGYVLCDSHMGAVAKVYVSGEGDDWQKHGDNPRFPEACANARLIAAAPDMLDALKELLKAADFVGSGVVDWAKWLDDARAQARAAIVKATNG